jgi:rhodanese-related sulfurtransferase
MSISEMDEPFERVDVTRGRELLDAGGLTWIDVREPAEWQKGRIPGAVLVPLNRLLLAPRQHLAGAPAVVFYCALGIRSAVACEAAAAVGLTRVFNLEGGIEAWLRHGHPVAC